MKNLESTHRFKVAIAYYRNMLLTDPDRRGDVGRAKFKWGITIPSDDPTWAEAIKVALDKVGHQEVMDPTEWFHDVWEEVGLYMAYV